MYEDTGSGTVRTLLSGTDVSAGGTGWVVLPLWASGTGQASAARADLHGARAAVSALDQVVSEWTYVAATAVSARAGS